MIQRYPVVPDQNAVGGRSLCWLPVACIECPQSPHRAADLAASHPALTHTHAQSTQVAKPVTKSVRARRSVSVRAEEGAGSSAPAKVQRPANSPLFFTGVSEQSLSYLDGSLPGDFGFDPLVCSPAKSLVDR